MLEDAVRALYASWYLPRPGDYSDAVTETVTRSVLDGPFADFLNSLPAGGGSIALTDVPESMA
jgi:hypothetical protein